jgi:hypothetical protein
MTRRHRVFEFFLRSASPVLARHHGRAFADEVIDDTRTPVRSSLATTGGRLRTR